MIIDKRKATEQKLTDVEPVLDNVRSPLRTSFPSLLSRSCKSTKVRRWCWSTNVPSKKKKTRIRINYFSTGKRSRNFLCAKSCAKDERSCDRTLSAPPAIPIFPSILTFFQTSSLHLFLSLPLFPSSCPVNTRSSESWLLATTQRPTRSPGVPLSRLVCTFSKHILERSLLPSARRLSCFRIVLLSFSLSQFIELDGTDNPVSTILSILIIERRGITTIITATEHGACLLPCRFES